MFEPVDRWGAGVCFSPAPDEASGFGCSQPDPEWLPVSPWPRPPPAGITGQDDLGWQQGLASRGPKPRLEPSSSSSSREVGDGPVGFSPSPPKSRLAERVSVGGGPCWWGAEGRGTSSALRAGPPRRSVPILVSSAWMRSCAWRRAPQRCPRPDPQVQRTPACAVGPAHVARSRSALSSVRLEGAWIAVGGAASHKQVGAFATGLGAERWPAAGVLGAESRLLGVRVRRLPFCRSPQVFRRTALLARRLFWPRLRPAGRSVLRTFFSLPACLL